MFKKRLLELCNSSKKWIAMTVLMNWISIICNILVILFIGNTIDKLINSNLEINYLRDGLYIGSLLVIRFLANYYSTRFSLNSSSEVKKVLREKIYEKLLDIGVNYNKFISTSSVVQIGVDGVEALEIYFGRFLPQLFYSALAPLTLFVVVSFISFKVALVLLICVPLIPLTIMAVMKIAKKLLSKYWGVYTNLGDSFLENLQGLTTLKIFDLDEEKYKEMNEDAENFRKITMRVLLMQLNSITIMDLVAFGGAAAGTIVALIQFKNGQIPVGSLLIIILLSSEFFIPLRLLGSYFHIAMNGMAASDRMFGILDAEEREKNVETNEEIKLNDIKVSLRNVDFSYDGEREVLKNINMDVTPGGLVAIVGESGSGKSTIASLILNNYKVTNGEISINNLNIENISLDNIYGNIALVSTNSYIFNGTILDNLLMAKKDATEEDINNALKTARLYDFVKGLKDGLLTDVGQAGSALSGGQKQRLALARVILADRPMIIFDEATSNIDVESEESIWEAIYELSKEKTILVISHRLANVTDAKNIYVMNKGKLVENGTHEELMKNESCYYNMVNKQNELEMIREVC